MGEEGRGRGWEMKRGPSVSETTEWQGRATNKTGKSRKLYNVKIHFLRSLVFWDPELKISNKVLII